MLYKDRKKNTLKQGKSEGKDSAWKDYFDDLFKIQSRWKGRSSDIRKG